MFGKTTFAVACAAMLAQGVSGAAIEPLVHLSKRAIASGVGNAYVDNTGETLLASAAALVTANTGSSSTLQNRFRLNSAAATGNLASAQLPNGKTVIGVGYAVAGGTSGDGGGGACTFDIQVRLDGGSSGETGYTVTSTSGYSTKAVTDFDEPLVDNTLAVYYNAGAAANCIFQSHVVFDMADSPLTRVETPAAVAPAERLACSDDDPVDLTQVNSGTQVSAAGEEGDDEKIIIAEIAVDAEEFTGIAYTVVAEVSGDTEEGCDFFVKAAFFDADDEQVGDFVIDPTVPAGCTTGRFVVPAEAEKIQLFAGKDDVTHECAFKYHFDFFTALPEIVEPYHVDEITCDDLVDYTDPEDLAENAGVVATTEDHSATDPVYLVAAKLPTVFSAYKATIQSIDAADDACPVTIRSQTWVEDSISTSTLVAAADFEETCLESVYYFFADGATEFELSAYPDPAAECTISYIVQYIEAISGADGLADDTPATCDDEVADFVAKKNSIALKDLTYNTQVKIVHVEVEAGAIGEADFVIKAYNQDDELPCNYELQVLSGYDNVQYSATYPLEDCTDTFLYIDTQATFVKAYIKNVSDDEALCDLAAQVNFYPADAPECEDDGEGSGDGDDSDDGDDDKKASALTLSSGMAYTAASVAAALALF